MDQTTRDEITKRLTEKGASLPCPRCGQSNFSVFGGYFNPSVQEELKALVLGGRSIPSAIVGCNNCGYLSLHALGVLGLLPKDEKDKANGNK